MKEVEIKEGLYKEYYFVFLFLVLDNSLVCYLFLKFQMPNPIVSYPKYNF